MLLATTNYFSGMSLKLKEKKNIASKHNRKIPTTGSQTSWLFTSLIKELNWDPPRQTTSAK